jgi:hypothetical protein
LTLGARFGTSNVGGYTYYDNGAPIRASSAGVSLYEFKIEFTAVQNAKISLQLTMDTSDEEARKTAAGETYDLQNKLVLLWDWAI